MKKLILLSITVLMFQYSFTQVVEVEKDLLKVNKDSIDGWKFGGITNINITQTALKNWAAGGENSMAVSGLENIFANYKKKKFKLGKHTRFRIRYLKTR